MAYTSNKTASYIKKYIIPNFSQKILKGNLKQKFIDDIITKLFKMFTFDAGIAFIYDKKIKNNNTNDVAVVAIIINNNP